MVPLPERVWITLMGENVHQTKDCQGIRDGHAKAVREGKRTWEPELWPVRLAVSGWPRAAAAGRGICQVCLPKASFPVGGEDAPERVAAAKGGKIAQALGNWLVARDQARAEKRRAREAAGEAPSPYYEDGDPFEEFELMRQDMTPWDAEDSSKGP